MKIAVISDIHGNLEAFSAVLADIDATHADKIISLGDNIGYGPDPEQVIRLLTERGIPSVIGNHELAVLDESRIEHFNPTARISILKTIAMLSHEAVSLIGRFPRFLSEGGVRYVHGFPPDSPTIYLFEPTERRLETVLRSLQEDICLVGHTHLLKVIYFDGHHLTSTVPEKGIFYLRKEGKYIINAGSVGQPRDGDNNAKYVIFDDAERTIDIRFVPYDIDAVSKKIRAAGLPEFNALRLR
ncbi:MAG: metallophosphoesterase family protein [Desulfobacterales bacterium]